MFTDELVEAAIRYVVHYQIQAIIAVDIFDILDNVGLVDGQWGCATGNIAELTCCIFLIIFISL